MTLDQAAALIDVGLQVLRGAAVDKLAMARALVALALDLAPVESLRDYLTDAARKRDEAIADAAERLKFGPPPSHREG